MIERLQQGSQQAVQAMSASNRHSQQAVLQVRHTQASLGQMNDAITTINQMNGQIRVAAQEQNTVSGEINLGLQVIASQGRAMLAGLDRVRLTSTRLREQSQQLATTVQQFTL